MIRVRPDTAPVQQRVEPGNAEFPSGRGTVQQVRAKLFTAYSTEGVTRTRTAVVRAHLGPAASPTFRTACNKVQNLAIVLVKVSHQTDLAMKG